MKNNRLETVKVACFVVIAVSLSVIAWSMVNQVIALEDIREQIMHIAFKLN
ncbi:hypothetical protein QFZ87_003167 [Bacillus sp. SLBN-46]|uniref:hypothetical protein n=1 Tax=Bacillus sp. SLBN-46 TaxID=3042283 RepID=UPI00285FFFA4|nr:hypothetical protein [Bacillus sp. SLBN-46]MDR6123570.1 hypothetical protein [Bacillus sp. SLBN-46]